MWPSLPISYLSDCLYQPVALWPSISTSYLCDRPYQPTTFVTVNTNQLPLWPSIPTSYHCDRPYQPVTIVTVTTNQLPLWPSLPTSYLRDRLYQPVTLVTVSTNQGYLCDRQYQPVTFVKGWLSKSSAVARSRGSCTKHRHRKFLPEKKNIHYSYQNIYTRIFLTNKKLHTIRSFRAGPNRPKFHWI